MSETMTLSSMDRWTTGPCMVCTVHVRAVVGCVDPPHLPHNAWFQRTPDGHALIGCRRGDVTATWRLECLGVEWARDVTRAVTSRRRGGWSAWVSSGRVTSANCWSSTARCCRLLLSVSSAVCCRCPSDRFSFNQSSSSTDIIHRHRQWRPNW